MTAINSAVSTAIRRLLPAALIVAVTTLGSSTLVSPSTACAEPNSSGSGASYDECVARGSNKRLCCSLANGQWTETKYYDKDGKYVGSSFDCTGLAMQHMPTTSSPGGVGQTFTPAPLSPVVRNPHVITGTFAPAAAG